MYHRVVVPLDGSKLAEEALPQAVEFARLAGATLHLIRVVDSTWVVRYGLSGLAIEAGAAEAVMRAERAETDAYLSRMQERLSATGIPVTVARREGRAADEIRAAVQPGDLLAMATHGRTGLARFALGSVAEEVTRHAASPVLLCRVGKEVAAAQGIVAAAR